MNGQRYVLANFKMNKNAGEIKKWADQILQLMYKRREKIRVKIGVAPSFVHILTAKSLFQGTDIMVGAQNMYYEERGAFTGEVSVSQLKDIGVDFVIIGHSERRKIFKEDNELIEKKLISAIRYGILPVLCVGETLGERENGLTEKVIDEQLKAVERIPDEMMKIDLVIAYEPVWAIGTGIPAKPDQIAEVINKIKNKLKNKFPKISVLYGGSIDENVAKEIRHICDGGLVGSASLDAQKFYKIAENFEI
jgi:triosephosphate isomerase